MSITKVSKGEKMKGKLSMLTTKKFGGKQYLFCMSGDRKSVEKKAKQMKAYRTKLLKSGNNWDLWISQN